MLCYPRLLIQTLTKGRAIGTKTVDIFVGPKKVHFHVHKDILCNRIPYFERVFRGSFEEASFNIATFPEGNPNRSTS